MRPGWEGPTAAGRVLQNLAASLKKRGLIILLSDLLEEPPAVAKGLRQLRARGSEVIVFHLLDRDELDFPFEAPAVFQDMEAELKLAADPQAVRAGYLAALGALIDDYRRACASHHIDYALTDTSVSLDRALVRYLNWRQNFRGR